MRAVACECHGSRIHRNAYMHTCEAHSLITGKRCWNPAYYRYRCGCVHEHVFHAWLCMSHAASSAGFCTYCRDLGHDCAVLAELDDDTTVTAP